MWENVRQNVWQIVWQNVWQISEFVVNVCDKPVNLWKMFVKILWICHESEVKSHVEKRVEKGMWKHVWKNMWKFSEFSAGLWFGQHKIAGGKPFPTIIFGAFFIINFGKSTAYFIRGFCAPEMMPTSSNISESVQTTSCSITITITTMSERFVDR